MTPPPIPLKVRLKEFLERLDTFILLITDLLWQHRWSKLLVLMALAWCFFANPSFINQILALLPGNFLLFDGYSFIYWVGLVGFLVAAVVSPPFIYSRPIQLEVQDAPRIGIKGLRAFDASDAPVFSRLQRIRQLREWLDEISHPKFQFSVLVGESGVGKTSFLHAGLLPRLSLPEAKIRAVYVKFSDRPPLEIIHSALVHQLGIPDEAGAVDLYHDFLLSIEKVNKPLILLLDQFEQFFIHQPRQDDRQPFVEVLKSWHQSPIPDLKIIISIRADWHHELTSLQQTFSNGIRQYPIFKLDGLEPEEAATALRVLSTTEKLGIDLNFAKEVTKQELVGADGKVLPVDLQLFAEFVRKQSNPELRMFNRDVFQRMGGFDVLEQRYLADALERLRFLGSPQLYEAAILILLALTDQERRVKGKFVTKVELQTQLRGLTSPREVVQVLDWLSSGDVWLVTPVQQGQELGYELVHERIIPALLRLAGRALKKLDRAHQLLERRLIAWKGNQQSKWYLLTWWELCLVGPYEPQLVGGKNRLAKEELLRQSWFQARWQMGVGSLVVILFLVTWLGWLTPFVQQAYLKTILAHRVSNANYGQRVETAVAFASLPDWQKVMDIAQTMGSEPTKVRDAIVQSIQTRTALEKPSNGKDWLAQTLTIVPSVQSESSKAAILRAVAKSASQLSDSQTAANLLNQALSTTAPFQYEVSKANVLPAIAKSASELKDPQTAANVLSQTLSTAASIQEPVNKAMVLAAIAEAASQLNDAPTANRLFDLAFSTATPIEDESNKSKVLGAIAESVGSLKNAQTADSVLKQVISMTNSLPSESSQSIVLQAIAEAAGRIKNKGIASGLLNQTLSKATDLQDEYSKSVVLNLVAQSYGKLNDPQLAATVFSQAITAITLTPDESNKAFVLQAIATASTQLAEPSIAAQVLDQTLTSSTPIRDEYNKTSVLHAIANAVSQLGEPKSFVDLLNQTLSSAVSIQDGYRRADIMQTIANSHVQLNNFQSAATVLNQALSTAVPIKSDSSKSIVLRAIAESAGEITDPSTASNLLNQTIFTAASIESEANKADVLGAIAKAIAQLTDRKIALGLLDQTLSAAAPIQSQTSKSVVMIEVAAAYGQLKAMDMAENFLKQRLDDAKTLPDRESQSVVMGNIGIALSRIADNYRQQSQIGAAHRLLGQAMTIMQPIQDVNSQRGSIQRSDVLKQIAEVYVKLQNWRQVNSTIGYCHHDNCRIDVATHGLITQGNLSHPVLITWRSEQEKEEKAKQSKPPSF